MFNDFFDSDDLYFYRRGLSGLRMMILWMRQMCLSLPTYYRRDADRCLREIWHSACAAIEQHDTTDLATLSPLERTREAWRRQARRDPFFGGFTLTDWFTEPLEAACDEADDAAVEAAVREIVLEQVRDAYRTWLDRPTPATSRLWEKLHEPQSDMWPIFGTVEHIIWQLVESGELDAFAEAEIARITELEEAEVEKTVAAVMAIMAGAKVAIAEEIAKGLTGKTPDTND